MSIIKRIAWALVYGTLGYFLVYFLFIAGLIPSTGILLTGMGFFIFFSIALIELVFLNYPGEPKNKK